MRRRIFTTVAAALCVLAAAPAVQAGPFFFYKFTVIADTQGGFPYQHLSGFPAINGSGRIAFDAVLTGGVEGMLTRLGTAGPNTLADTGAGEYFGFGISPSINSLNTVLFVGLKHGSDGIVEVFLRGEGNSATPLISSSDDLSEFCGTQINIQKTAVFRARLSDGRRVIRTQGAGQLTGVHRIIAEEGSEFSSIECSPSIDFDGNVAFIATRNGKRAIFTRATNGTLTQVVDTTSLFAGFSAVALNQQGGLAFTASLQGGGRGLFRTKNGVLTKIADTNTPGTGSPAGFSINESGQVAFELSAGANGSAVFRGPGGLFGRLIGTGSVLFGRTVAFAHVDRDAINSTNQIAVSIIFTDGSEMIARGDPVVNFPDAVLSTGALQLTTAMGKSVSVDTPIPVPQASLTLSFDVTFLTMGGDLTVKLGDAVIKSIAASEPGVPQHVSIPIDVRALAKERPLNHISALQFSLAGKPGTSAQIADVVIPGLFADRMDADALSRWRIDHSGGGSAAVVSTARLPVRIRLDQPNATTAGAYPTVAVLSTREFDATSDIERSSLRLSGRPMRATGNQAGGEQPACEARDVNADKLNDLVCEFDAGAPGRLKPEQRPRLEAMTRFGWGIAGSEPPRAVQSSKQK